MTLTIKRSSLSCIDLKTDTGGLCFAENTKKLLSNLVSAGMEPTPLKDFQIRSMFVSEVEHVENSTRRNPDCLYTRESVITLPAFVYDTKPCDGDVNYKCDI